MVRKLGFDAMVLLILIGLLLAACGGGGEDAGQSARPEVPAAYAGQTNPHADGASAGASIYEMNCTSCHGANGKGDNPTGQALDPKAADLTKLGDAGDDYVYWRIAEGGSEPFNSSMPAWKGVLSEDDMWNVVAYIRSLK